MPSQFLIRIQSLRERLPVGSTPEENRLVAEHFDSLRHLTDQGVVLLAGRTLNADPTGFGIIILEAASEAPARIVMENDPAVRSGVFRAELFPFRVALTGFTPA